MTDTLHFDLPAFEALVGTLKRGQTAIVDHLQVLIKRITLLCEGWTGARLLLHVGRASLAPWRSRE